MTLPPPESGAEAQAEGLWLSISDLAARKGVAKQTIAERVTRFEAQGLLTSRPGRGRAKLVNLAEYDRVAGETTDLGREQGAATRRGATAAPSAWPPTSTGTDPVYTQEQARKMAYSADREKIALGEDLERLVPVDLLRDEVLSVFAPIVARLDRLDGRADEVAAAVARDGGAGARAWLKAFKVELRNHIADGFAAVLAKVLSEPARPLDDFDPRLSADASPSGPID